MTRLWLLFLLGGAGLVLSPATSSAQFGARFGYGYGYSAGFPIFGRGGPFSYLPQFNYSYSSQLSIGSSLGGISLGSRYAYSGTAPPFFLYGSPYTYAPLYQQSGSYMTGGGLARPDLQLAAEQAMAKAQREAAIPDAKAQISGQWNYEKGAGPAGDTAVAVPGDGLRKALDASNPTDIASGQSLNELLKEIARVEAKGAKGPSGYIPALIMDDMRFAGSPAADLLNYARQAGHLRFPIAFDDPSLAALRADLETDFAAAATVVQAGKVPDQAKVAKLDTTVQRAQDAVGPVIKNLPFEDGAAVRRFLNRLSSAVKGMKGNTALGLIDPKWSAEGLTVADLVKHMTRFKLQFGPAPRGSEESYTTMHRNLATYLFVLTTPKK